MGWCYEDAKELEEFLQKMSEDRATENFGKLSPEGKIEKLKDDTRKLRELLVQVVEEIDCVEAVR